MAKSKAIPIVNPDSRKQQPAPQRGSSSIPSGLWTPDLSTFSSILPPSQLPSELESKNALRTATAKAKAKGKGAFKQEQDSEDENDAQSLSVYAQPFVPEVYRMINEKPGRPGQEFFTLPLRQVNLGLYVQSSISFNFLPSIPRPMESPKFSFTETNSLTAVDYEQFFRYHLDAEMQSRQREYEAFSLYNHPATFGHHTPDDASIFFLKVPGLRENNPYIEEDDIVQLRQLTILPDGRQPWWTGSIYHARVATIARATEMIGVKVHQLRSMGPHTYKTLTLNVQFIAPIASFIHMQEVLPVVQAALRDSTSIRQTEHSSSLGKIEPLVSTTPKSWLQSMLFPTEENSEIQTRLNPGSFQRQFIDDQVNWEQQKAIESICSQDYGTLPFLISGPPGTGKTKTIIETARQLLKNVKDVSHILMCAPSDPAADTLVQRLGSEFSPKEMLRLNRPTRTFAEVPSEVLPYCFLLQDAFALPPFPQLMSYKVVVTTCRDTCILLYARMTNSDLYAAEYGLQNAIHPSDPSHAPTKLHWTALLMDEAAQALEPEALIPMAVVAPPAVPLDLIFTPLVVMAGDQYQLGPRTALPQSPLKTSLFARLFARPVYSKHPLARGNQGTAPPPLRRGMLPILRPAFSNLIRNYRSHPAILAVPSALYYHDTLEPEASGTDQLKEWPVWQGRQWPVLFHNNGSADELELGGAGWFNLGEAEAAVEYAASLVQSGLVPQKEICIMSPFKAQVRYLRKLARRPTYGSLWDVNVGPTEAFQGLERGVVILCTTRSKKRFIERDKEMGWGIIGMPNMMNVALTRAKLGLIVIGRREVLVSDPPWKAFLDFCDRNGLVAGRPAAGARLTGSETSTERTRLEKVLLAQDQHPESMRVLKGVSDLDDEMWG